MDSEALENIRLFGISGSPRKGSTDYVVKEALRYAEEKYRAETEYFSVHNKALNFCIHCDYCIKKKQGWLLWADAWIIGTPVYQGTVSGQVKVMLDRCRAVVAKGPKAFRNKVGAAIAVGGDRIGGQELAIQTILDFYIISEIIPVGGGSFGANLGGTFWSRDKGAEGVKDDSEGLRSLYKTMDRLIHVASLIKRLDAFIIN